MDLLQYKLITRLNMTFDLGYIAISVNQIWTILSNTTVRLQSFITGQPTHSVGGGQTSNGRWRLSSSVVVCNTPWRAAGSFTRAGQAMTSGCLQSNYSSTAARRASSVTSR